jgi:hypothetical protein
MILLSCTVIDPTLQNASAHRLSSPTSSSWVNSSSNRNKKNREEEVRQVRLKQQEELNRIAREVAEREKQEQDNNSNQTTVTETKITKKKKSTVSMRPAAASDGYNPMQPWTSSGGGGYKYVNDYRLISVVIQHNIFSLMIFEYI